MSNRLSSNFRRLSYEESENILNAVLKESFPDQHFSYKKNNFSGGSYIEIFWTNGPSVMMLEKITSNLEGSVIDPTSEKKKNKIFMIDGVKVQFGIDFIIGRRSLSDLEIQQAIDLVFQNWRADFEREKKNKPAVLEYREGLLWEEYIPSMMISIQAAIQDMLGKITEYDYPKHSKTLERIKNIV